MQVNLTRAEARYIREIMTRRLQQAYTNDDTHQMTTTIRIKMVEALRV